MKQVIIKLLDVVIDNLDVNKMDRLNFCYFKQNIKVIEHLLKKDESFRFSSEFELSSIIKEDYLYNPKKMGLNLKACFCSGTDDNTTIMFSNLQDGWFSLFNYISKGIVMESYYFKITSNKIESPCNYFVKKDKNGNQRVIYTLKDSKWIFYEKGEPLLIEKLEYYQAKRKRDRFTKDILIEYCNQLGILENSSLFLNMDNCFSVLL